MAKRIYIVLEKHIYIYVEKKNREEEKYREFMWKKPRGKLVFFDNKHVKEQKKEKKNVKTENLAFSFLFFAEKKSKKKKYGEKK